MGRTPLHDLRSRLEELAELVDCEYEQVLAMAENPDIVRELAEKFRLVDQQLVGKCYEHPHYDRYVRELLSGDDWLWHLADGGYSRARASLTGGPSQVMNFDIGLSSDRAFAIWDCCKGGRA